ncbi:MAG: hypothetical protein QOE70_1654 [Chthoniobacter sp.]|nr:hypothetical protein [Chthoniobacter sp.]
MQFGILPVLPIAFAIWRGAVKMNVSLLVFRQLNIPPNEKMLTFGAESQLIE